MRTKRVYIATPYGGHGEDVVLNVRQAILIGERIIRGTTEWLPFVPHLFHLWHLISPQAYNFWRGMDLDWMLACHALVRTGGASSGADKDADQAVAKGIPVFLSVEEFIDWSVKEE